MKIGNIHVNYNTSREGIYPITPITLLEFFFGCYFLEFPWPSGLGTTAVYAILILL